jgi:tetrapyrrole methylase family protein/MazG family protein
MTKYDFKKVTQLAAKLRSKTGCPWDRKQTIESMLKHLIEEAGEVRQAIKKNDHKNLEEELGDLLFQIVMISQIAKEQKYFNMDDVTNGIAKKIISRHTWVFGKDKAKTPEDALKMWKKNKKREKRR